MEREYNEYFVYIIIICPKIWDKTYYTKERIKTDDKDWLIEPKDKL